MQRLQDNLNYYNRHYQSIVNNRNSYTSTRTHQEYGPWQPNTWQVSGAEIFATKSLGWWYGVHWKRGRCGQHMKNDTATREDIRQTLAAKLGCSPECIMLDPHINPRGNDPTWHTGCGDAIMFSSYNIGYQYRQLETRVETYFDQAKYNAALNSCQSNINSARAAISRFQQEEARKAAAAEAARLEGVRKQQQEALLAKQKAEAELLRKEEEKKQQIIDMVSSKDDKGRSELLIKFFDQADSDFIISQIKAKGFDVNYLAYLSIQNNCDALFALSLEEGAELASYQFEGKTLIQHIIHDANAEFLQKALAKCNDLSVTVTGAIEQGDLLTIEKLHEHDANLLQNKYKGQTLLQIAISNNSAIEIIQKLIELDNSCCSILADNGESALKLAVINGNDEIIKLIEGQASIEEEIEQLSSDVDAQLKSKILENQDMETLIRIFKGESISLEKYIIDNMSLNDNEEWEDFELDNIHDRNNNMQIISVLEQAKQQDDEVVHLSGHGPNEYFSDLGYE